jgi:hypothetical protein
MAQLADVDKVDEEDMLPMLTVDAKPKNNLKASGDYPFPFTNNKSKKVPPQPCRNCSNPLHYDCDCTSWRNRGCPGGKAAPAGRANHAYNKAYIAMLEEDDLDYEVHCTTFNAVVDTSTTTEALAVEVNLGIVESSHSDVNDPGELEDPWSSLPVNLSELEEPNDKPFESVYEPSPMWEHPPGHAVEGVDAFKVYCHVNNLKEPATLVVGDSGTVPTLISK